MGRTGAGKDTFSKTFDDALTNHFASVTSVPAYGSPTNLPPRLTSPFYSSALIIYAPD